MIINLCCELKGISLESLFRSLSTQELRLVLGTLLEVLKSGADCNQSDGPEDPLPASEKTIIQAISSCRTLLQIILGCSPDLFRDILKEDFLKIMISKGLFCSTGVRHEVSVFLHGLSTNDSINPVLRNTYVESCLRVLLSNLAALDFNKPVDSYFSLLTHFVSHMGFLASKLDLKDPFKYVSKTLREMPVVETYGGSFDPILVGMLDLGSAICKLIDLSESESINEFLFQITDICLFSYPSFFSETSLKPKCKSRESRLAALNCLLSLAARSTDYFDMIYSRVCDISPSVDIFAQDVWDYDPSLLLRQSNSYCGIKNLGCICYINSLVQQLFHTPGFPAALLDVVIPEGEKHSSFIFHLQNLFIQLWGGVLFSCDPGAFCLSFKDWEGNSVDVSVQKDVNEFLNMLFDYVDSFVKGSGQELLLKSLFGGVFSNELVGDLNTCGHVTEKLEDFYCLSLDVKDRSSLIDSFKAFVAGEKLAGSNAVFCDQCQRKTDRIKRVSLKSPPKNLIVHLKRFELNYETMSMQKLNDQFEFPLEFDVYPFTEEALSQALDNQMTIDEDKKDSSSDGKESCIFESRAVSEKKKKLMYQLVGILVHQGEANRGHYYSFIKDRSNSVSRGKWFEFNDSKVSPFDPSQVPLVAFGGKEDYIDETFNDPAYGLGNSNTVILQRDKDYCAYLLVYSNEAETGHDDALSPYRALSLETLNQKTSSNLLNSLSQQNVALLKDVHLFSDEFELFVQGFLQVARNLKETTRMRKAAKLGLEYLVKVLNHRISRKGSLEFFSSLNAFSSSPEVSNAVLKHLVTDKASLRKLLFESRSQVTRREQCVWISQLCRCASDASAREDFCTCMLEAFAHVPANWERMGTFFSLLCTLVTSDPNFAKFFLTKQIILRMLDLIYEDPSKLDICKIPRNSTGARPRLGNSMNKPDFSDYLKLWNSLLSFQTEDSNFQSLVASVELDSLRDPLFLEKLCSSTTSDASEKQLEGILVSLISNSQDMSQNFLEAICRILVSEDTENLICCFLSFKAFLSVEDELKAWRLSAGLASILQTIKDQSNFWKATDFSLTEICKLAYENKQVLSFLQDHTEMLQWSLSWLLVNQKPPGADSTGVVQLFKESTPANLWQALGGSSAHYGFSPLEKHEIIKSIVTAGSIEKAIENTEECMAWLSRE